MINNYEIFFESDKYKMTCEYLFKDVCDIHNRLFNHKAAIQGLANNFVKEFEERRGESDHASISHSLELVTDCVNRAYPTVTQDLEKGLESVLNEVKKTTQACGRIIQDCDDKKTDWLEGERARRQGEWEDFLATQESRKSRIDGEFASHVRALEAHYSELEEKLRTGGKPTL